MKRIITLSLFVMATMLAEANVIDFSYNTSDTPASLFGTGSKETYDIAIKIADPAYVGAKVTGLSVGFNVNSSAFADLNGWMSSQLRLTSKKNDPDICTYPATVKDGKLEIVFDNPCTIPEGGAWVGYSFTITSLGQDLGNVLKPVEVVPADNDTDLGLWIHSTKTYPRWMDAGTKYELASTLVAHLDTDFGPNDVAVYLPDEFYSVVANSSTLRLKLVNHGDEPLTDISYSYKGETIEGTGSASLPSPLAPKGKSCEIDIDIPPVSRLGKIPFNITIDKCNGKVNNDPFRNAVSTLNVWSFIPTTRPLVEEFSGLNCGWCPGGYVAMEEMNHLQCDNFIGLAYHSQSYETGAMVTVLNKDYPYPVLSFPYVVVNRDIALNDLSLLPEIWDACAARIVPAEVTLEVEWCDDGSGDIMVYPTFTFPIETSGEYYRVAIALIADGLSNPDWKQANYYSGEAEGNGIESELWNIFLEGPKYITGLTFNNVVAWFKDTKGVSCELPSNIPAGSPIKIKKRIPIAEVVNIRKQQFLNDGAKLYAVAMLLDATTGKSVNCNKSAPLNYSVSGQELVPDGATTQVNETYTNLQGITVAQPKMGIYIRTTVFNDGSRKIEKVFLH